MKTRMIIILVALVSTLTGCKTQQMSVCENVKDPMQLPWLKELVKSGYQDAGVLSIEKVTYRSEDTNTEGVGFVVYTEPICCDLIGPGVYDCDGKVLNSYGGIAGGCYGLRRLLNCYSLAGENLRHRRINISHLYTT